MGTHSLRPLPFFPAPYPGESLYSILCRYHVRSGNASPHRTIRQLFGDYSSLNSTLLLPPMLDHFDFWTESNELSSEQLLRHHTAYSLCALKNFNLFQDIFSGASHSSIFSQRLRRGWFDQLPIQHPSHELRYCPQCAIEQRKIYGESYWQILPQLDGVEYCPVHRIRIASSGILTTRMQHAFFPADTVLREANLSPIASRRIWYSQKHIEEYPELFISMSLAAYYLWKNLPRVSGIWFLISRYRSKLCVASDFWQTTNCVKTRLLENNPYPIVNELLYACRSPLDLRFINFMRLTLSQHTMMISMLFDSPEALFCHENLTDLI